MRDNVGFMKSFQPLGESERKTLAQVSRILSRANVIPCTNCKYCKSACPKSISIPDLLRLYNDHVIYGTTQMLRRSYRFYVGKDSRASDCLHCGACESRCPQRIKISDQMTRIAELFEP